MHLPQLVPVGDSAAELLTPRWDAVVVVSPSFRALDERPLAEAVRQIEPLDARVGKQVVAVHAPGLANSRLVLAPTGPLDGDHDDVSRFAQAAVAGVTCARDMGASRVLLLVARQPVDPSFERAVEVAVFAALHVLAVDDGATVKELGFQVPAGIEGDELARVARAIERARGLERAILQHGSSPEHVVNTVAQRLAGLPVGVEVASADAIDVQYPLLAACGGGRVLNLSYESAAASEQLLVAAAAFCAPGEGQSGGLDARVTVALACALTLLAAELKPRQVSLEVQLALGTTAPVLAPGASAITCHSGRKIWAGSAMGEMLLLADCLSLFRERAKSLALPRVISLGMSSPQVARALGRCTVVVDNGPARQSRLGSSLVALGERWGDRLELLSLRAEDHDRMQQAGGALRFDSDRTPTADAAWLRLASGLDRHGRGTRRPLAYTHLDVGPSLRATSDGNMEAGALVTLAARWLIDN